jgi:delta-aminolevulinic acid dehydratase/porphobilinogen synthase
MNLIERPRRLRRNETIRALVRETTLTPTIWSIRCLFVKAKVFVAKSVQCLVFLICRSMNW